MKGNKTYKFAIFKLIFEESPNTCTKVDIYWTIIAWITWI